MARVHERALVVGKFAPLHLGHEALLERAAAECRELFVISYQNPERRGYESDRRRSWLTTRFPRARVLVVDPPLLAGLEGAPALPRDDAEDRVHRRFVGFLCLFVLGCTVDAVYTSEDYGPGFAAELERYFAEHGRATGVEHVWFDRERKRVPISATAIRRAPHELRRYLSKGVYASFVERIALVGGESSGKSTLAEALARHFQTAFVPEYGRTLWEAKHGQLVYDDLLEIGRCQVAMEDEALERANRYLFCDTTPLVTRLYSEAMFGRAAEPLERLAERDYALTLVCAPDFEFCQDGTRRDAAFRAQQHEKLVGALELRRTPYVVVSGSLEQRVRAVATLLDGRASTPSEGAD